MFCKKSLVCALYFLLVWMYEGYAQHTDPNETITISVLPGKQPEVKKSPASNKPASEKTILLNRDNNRTNSIVLTINSTGTICNRGEGVITVTASGGVPPYKYQINTWGQRPIGYFVGLGPGSYTVSAEDATGATASQLVTITNFFNQPTVRYQSYTLPTCPALDNGTVTLAATGGVPPYSYSMDAVNWQTSNVFTGLTPGWYSFFVKDENGCTNVFSDFYGSVACNFGYGLSYSNSSCQNTGYVSITASNGVAPYTYSMDGINFVPVGHFTNLTPGIHRLYAKDATGKVGTYSIVMYPYCPLLTVTTMAACNLDDGTITITAREGTPPFTYSIDGINFQSGNVFTGLTSGYYYATAKDANGTINFANVFVDKNCPKVSATKTDEICGTSNGSITATGTQGTQPYQYSIDGTNFQSSNVFSGLSAGTYTVTIKDINGYTGTTAITLRNNCLLVSAVPQHVVCSNRNGKITVTGSGGFVPYQYSIDGSNFQSQNEFNGLPAGTYTITIRDATNATSTTTVEIEDSPGPEFTASSFPASCVGNDGFINVNASGGTPPLAYSLDGVNYQSGNQFVNLRPDQYRVTVRDVNGCIFFQTVTVNFYCLSVNATTTDDICGNSNGTITANAMNGALPYEYSLDGINYQDNNTFTGLIAGNYTAYARDANGTVKTTPVTVHPYCVTVTAIADNEICGNKNGRIKATGSNGELPYQFSIDGTNFQASDVFQQLETGTYTVTIKDATGITNTTSVSVGFTAGPQVNVNALTAYCRNNDGSATLNGLGGTSPLLFSIDGIRFETNPVFNNLASGNYTARVRDVNGCLASSPFIVPLTNDLNVDAGADKTICEGTRAELTAISGGDAFTWTPSSGLNQVVGKDIMASPITTTKYFVTATLGLCTKMDSVTVFVNPAPVALAATVAPICFGQSTTLQGTGGINCSWSPATYLDDPNSCNPVVSKPTNSISYQLTVTDFLGCRSIQPSTVMVNVTPPAKLFAGNDTVVMANQPFRLNATDINNSGFNRYLWSPANGLNNALIKDPVVTIDRPMTYTVTAMTPAGCEGTDEINIKVYPGPEIYVPNAFSPNNDGRNDILRAIPVGIKEFRFFAIFNRWGQQIFYTTDAKAGWDGKLGPHMQGTNTFTWKAAGLDSQGRLVERKGIVIIIR